MTCARVFVAAMAVSSSCAPPGAFNCVDDSACRAASGSGTCEDGFCTFPAPDCPSGRRYGEHSGALAGQCVDPAGTSGPITSGSAGSAGVDDGPTPGTSSTTSETSGGTLAVGSGDASDSSGAIGSESDAGSESTGGPLVDPDLVLWLTLDDPRGPTVVDASPQGNHGECAAAACPTSTPGALAGAAGFDGVDDVIAVPHDASLDTSDGLTIAAWIHLDAQPTIHEAIVGKPVGTGIHNTWELYFFPETEGVSLNFNLVMADGVSEANASVPGPFPVGDWTHVAGRWDGAEAVLFVDGQALGSDNTTEFLIDDQPILVGADDDHDGGPSAWFTGAIDDVRLYRRALDDAEIAALFARGP